MSISRQQLRRGAAVAGAGLVAVALLADMARGARFSAFGAGQAALLAAGIVLLLAAAGPRLPGVWRGTALLLLNVVVLLLVLDLAAWLALGRLPRGTYAGGIPPTWYDSQPWTATYRREFVAVNEKLRYEPYVMWAGMPARGALVSVDTAGRRTTPGTRCGPGAYRVFTFGGSTMGGVGAPDSATIAAHLQRLLEALTSRDVCVVNLGERAYVSTQELIRLERELQHGRVPDVAVFYDGINDVINAWRYGEAGIHNNVDRIARKLEQPPWDAWINTWHLTRLLRALLARPASDERRVDAPPPDPASLGAAVAAVWRENCHMAAALGARYRFIVACFLQPAIAVGDKPLTDAERSSAAQMPAGQRDAFRRVYASIRSQPPTAVVYADLSDAFNATPRQLYLDWYHVTPPANEMVAQRMAREIAAARGFPARTAGGSVAPERAAVRREP